MKYDKILLAVDDSPPSIRSAKYGYKLAKDLKAKVALLYVIDIALTYRNMEYGNSPKQELGKLKLAAEDILNNFKNDFGEGVMTEMFTPEGNIKETILQMAQEWGAKIIVAGSHGRTGLMGLLRDSISEYLIRHSPVPVFVVPIEMI